MLKYLSNNRHISSYVAWPLDNILYMYSCCSDIMYLFDLNNKELSAKRILTNNVSQKGSYSDVIEHKGILYFIPWHDSAIMRYDPKIDAVSRIHIEESLRDCYYMPAIYENTLYLLPGEYSNVLPCMSLRNETVKYMDLDYGKEWHSPEMADHLSFGGGHTVGEKVFRCLWQHNGVQEFNLVSRKTKTYELPINIVGHKIRYDGRYFWITQFKSSIIRIWDATCNRVVEEIDLSDKLGIENVYPRHMEIDDDYVYIATGYGKALIVIIDLQSREIECYDCEELPEFKILPHNNNTDFSALIKVCPDKSVVFVPYNTNGIIVLSPERKLSFYSACYDISRLNIDTGGRIEYCEEGCNLEQYVNYVGSIQQDDEIGRQMAGDIIWGKFSK